MPDFGGADKNWNEEEVGFGGGCISVEDQKLERRKKEEEGVNPTNIGIVRGTVSVATIVVVSAGVNI